MIIQNAIKIVENHPEEIFLVSSHRHDYNGYTFKDGTSIFVDGGTDYIRRGGDDIGKPADGYATKWVDWSLDDKVPFDTIKDRLLWGTRGKDGMSPLKYVRLVTCETDHLKAILDYAETNPISPIYRNVIISILGDRTVVSPKLCKCGIGIAEELHSCPFSEEMSGNCEPTCTCCKFCTRECAMDI